MVTQAEAQAELARRRATKQQPQAPVPAPTPPPTNDPSATMAPAPAQRYSWDQEEITPEKAQAELAKRAMGAQQGPPMPPPDEMRRLRLREIARGATQQQSSGGTGVGGIFKDAYTLGLQKPMAGLASGVNSMISGGGFGEGYTEGTKGYQEALDQSEQEAGAAGTAAGIVGGIVSGRPGRNFSLRAPGGILKTMGGAAATSGIEGAARNSEDWGSAAKGAAEGATIGAATAGALHLAGDTLIPAFRNRRAQVRAETRGPTPDTLRNEARTLYGQMRDSGTVFSERQALDLGDRLGPALRAENVSIRDMPLAEDILQHRGAMTLERLQQIRTKASELARSSDSKERRMAGVMLREIDDFVGNNQPDITSLAPDQLADIWGRARTHWRTAALADDLGWTIDKARRRAASTNSGGNVENAIRQNVRGVIDRVEKPGAYNPFNAGTMDEMNQIVEGTRGQNLMRGAGNWLRSIPGVGATVTPALLAAGGGLASGDMTSLIAGGAIPLASFATSKGLSAASRNIAEDAADRLIGGVARGAPMLNPAQQAILQGPPTRARLALMQMLNLQSAGASAGGRTAAKEEGQWRRGQ